jgi:hypothetical protein
MYTESEVKFLLQALPVEHATSGRSALAPMADWRKVGCPPEFFQRHLEHRAKKAASRFAEFRNSQVAPHASPDALSLKDQLEASQLF